jgi:S-layer protein
VSSLVDLSGYAGLTTINVNQGTDVSLKAATTTDVNVSGVTGAVEIAEARNVDVTHTKADQNITVGSYVAAAADDANTSGEITGTIDITDTDQGSGVIIVDGGTDVSVTTTSETATGTITVGANTAATGTVNVTQNLESDGEAALNNTTDGGIAVTGGTSITINSNATSDAKDKDSDAAITMHDISATGSEDTTEVTVTQTKTINTVSTPAEDEVKATHEVTFKALNAGQTTTLNGLTFTASTNMAAADVAQAFANLTVDDTQSETGPTANGFYTGAFNTASGWTSGAADGAKVVFTAPAFDTAAKMTVAGDVEADVTAAIVAGSDAVAKDESANDITYGDVAVDDHAGTADATVETITIDGYKDAVIGGANNVDALTDLTLRNSDGTTALSTAVTSLNLTLDNMGDASTAAVSLDTSAANVETLTITTENEASDVDLTAAAVTALTVNAGVDLDLSSSTMSTVLGTVSVTGAGAVDLSDISTASALNSFDASGNAGGVTATIDANSANVGDIEEYIFSDGDDAVSLADATVDVDVTLAAGDDVLTLESFGDGTITNVGTDTTLTAALDGGAGTNTLQMSAGDAAAASGAVTFETKISGFQKLELGAAQVTDDGTNDTDVTIDLANMDDINYVIANGTVMANDTATSADGALILNNLANNGTVELNGEGNVEVGVTDADTGTADSLNLVGNAAKGVVTAADVETVNIDAAAGDSTFVLTADSVETIVITGDEFVNLTDAADYASAALGDASSIVNTGNSLTMIDASAMTDGGIVAATSLAEQTIKGGAGADYLTADNGKAVIEGGAGDDTIYVTDGATSAVIDGGAGADTFDITGAALGVEAFATFNNVDAGDTFMLNAASFSSEAVDMTLDDPSTSDWINAAFSQTSADESIWFQHNGNTYIAVNDATSGDDAYDAADVVVKLTGLVDLSAASFNDAGTLELA